MTSISRERLKSVVPTALWRVFDSPKNVKSDFVIVVTVVIIVNLAHYEYVYHTNLHDGLFTVSIVKETAKK